MGWKKSACREFISHPREKFRHPRHESRIICAKNCADLRGFHARMRGDVMASIHSWERRWN
jgi:hypothetical protein